MKGINELRFETDGTHQLFREQINRIIGEIEKLNKNYEETAKMLKEQGKSIIN